MNARFTHARPSAANGRLHTLATLEALEDRRLMTAMIVGTPVQSAALNVKIPAPLVAGLTPQDSGASAASSKGSTAATTTTATVAKPEFYSQGVLRFLVKNGYLTQDEATQSKGRRSVVDELVQIKRDAASVTASPAALQAAIGLVLKGQNKEAERTVIASGLGLPAEALQSKLTTKQLVKYVGTLDVLNEGGRAKDPAHWKDVIARGTEATLKDAVVTSLGLPADALKTNLTAKGLVENVGLLRDVGAGDKAIDPTYWQEVSAKGTTAALADAVRDTLDIPDAAARGKTASQLLDGAAEIRELGADERSAKAWVGLDKLKQGQIKADQFAKDYADGKDIDPQQADAKTNSAADNVRDNVQNAAVEAGQGFDAAAADDAVHNTQPAAGANGAAASSAAAGSQASQQNAGTAVDPIIAAFAGFGPHGEDGGADGGVADAVVVVHNNDDGSYSTTIYELGADGNPVVVATETFTDADGDGVYEGDHNGRGDRPDDGAYPATKNDDGGYTYDSGNEDQNGDGQNDDGNGGGSDDDDDGDNSNDNNGGDANAAAPADGAGSDQGADTPAVSSASTPRPDADPSNPQAWLNFLLTTPMGRAELKSIGAQLAQHESGGFTDPAEDGGVSLFSAAAFYTSPLGRGVLPALKVVGGDVDYPDGEQPGVTFDRRQLLSIQLAAGGTLVDPEHYVQPKLPPGGNNPILPPVGINPGGGGTRRGANTTGGATATGSAAVFSTVRISTASQAVPASAVQSAAVKVSATATIAKTVVK